MSSAPRGAVRWVRCTDSLLDPAALGPHEAATSSVSGKLWWRG